MDTTLNEIVVHINETIDEAMFDALEQGIRRDRGVVSVGRGATNQDHLMVVVYDSEIARASDILHNFQERGLHAQVIGM